MSQVMQPNNPKPIMKYACKAFSLIGKNVYLDETLADVHFILNSGDDQTERVPAHKIILTASSDVFRAMFSGAWKEKDEVTISDIPAAAFKQFLQFFYLDNVELAGEYVDKIIDLGEQYNMTECLKICERFLEDNLTIENTCAAYNLATLYKLGELKRLCEANICLNAKIILKTDGFTKCYRGVLRHILQMDVLMCAETVVFNACMDWVKAKSGGTLTKQDVDIHLGDLFYGIRFGSMKMEEFVQIFDSYSLPSLFTFEEHKEIVRMIVSKEYKSNMFSGNRRQNDISAIECTSEIEYYDSHIDNTQAGDEKVFSVSSNSILVGIVCKMNAVTNTVQFGSYKQHDVSKFFFDLSILDIRDSAEDSGANEHLHYSIKNFETEENDTNKYMLPNPIIIRRGLKYKIEIRHFGRSTPGYSSYGRKRGKNALIDSLLFAKI